jgi:regulator of sigma E protease
MFITIISFIFVFGLLVLFHEFGHFITAKLNGITVHEFALGMGPKVFKIDGEETTYSIRALPLGGYIRMEGEDEQSEKPGSFSEKSPWRRLSVIVAGPMMNFVLAILLFAMIFSIIGIPTTAIDEFTDRSPAQAAGIQQGDQITAINNVTIDSWDDVYENISQSEGEITLTVERDNETITYQLQPITEEETGRKIVGIVPELSRNVFRTIPYAFSQTAFITKEIIKFVGQLPFGGSDAGEVVGPVGIISIVGDAAERSFLDLFNIAGYISINLAIINLLPLPALDGGRMLFIIVEILRGKPVDPEKEGFVHLVGFIILLSLMAFLVFRDVRNLL